MRSGHQGQRKRDDGGLGPSMSQGPHLDPLFHLRRQGSSAIHRENDQVAARVEDPLAPPVAAGDVDDARWVPVNQLGSFPGLPSPAKIALLPLSRARQAVAAGVEISKHQRHSC